MTTLPSAQDKSDLLELIKKIPNISADFLKKFEEKLQTMSEEDFNSAKKSITDTAKKIIEHQEKFIQTLNNIQRNDINPVFKNLEKASRENEKQMAKNILSQL
ncbi:hypothetical protein HZA41_03605 [Candidatus Peregrinibacteria bacterium]|nr:hypothetical protein [Candidatus Peregrinibacteria bacterium]